MTMVRACRQTAGRGQRGNSWESQPDMNFTGSLFFKLPGFSAKNQFIISEAVALAVVDALKLLDVDAKVKWPNDVYVGDRKICGILIEHSVMGMNLSHSIAGIGVNLNQSEFFSDAPNPASVIQLTKNSHSIEDFTHSLGRILEKSLNALTDDDALKSTHQRFLDTLWRGDGNYYSFRDVKSGCKFKARIADIEMSGQLLLSLPDNTTRRYVFKEVEFLLN